MYYDKSKLLGYNALFHFVIGARGIGKTYAFKKWAITDYLKNGTTCWWIMRYQTELDKIKTNSRFFADITDQFPDFTFKIDGSVGYLGEGNDPKNVVWHPFISFQALSNTAIKAISDPACSKIVFDEFIPLPGIRYLKNEVERFLEFYFTISRGRDLRAFFLANNVTAVSPYFTYFGIRPGEREFTSSGDIVIQNARTRMFSEKMRETRFGRMVAGSHYAQYAIDNASFADNDTFVNPSMPRRSRELFYLKTEYGLFCVSVCQPASLYVRKIKTAPDGAAVYAVNSMLHDERTIQISAHAQMIRNILRRYYSEGLIMFSSVQCKSEFLHVFAGWTS